MKSVNNKKVLTEVIQSKVDIILGFVQVVPDINSCLTRIESHIGVIESDLRSIKLVLKGQPVDICQLKAAVHSH